MPNKEKLESRLEDLSSKHVYEKVIFLLEENGVVFEEYAHKPLFTMDETDELYNGIPEQQVKVIFAREYKTKSVYGFCLIVWTGNKRIDFLKAAEVLGVKKVGMASPEEVLENLMIEIGALSPFGYANKYPVILDGDLLSQPELYINPGVHDKTIKLSSVDMFKAVEVTSAELKII